MRAANLVNRIIVRGGIDNYDIERAVRRYLERPEKCDRLGMPGPVDENAGDQASL